MTPRFLAQAVGGPWPQCVNKERRRNLPCVVSLGRPGAIWVIVSGRVRCASLKLRRSSQAGEGDLGDILK